MLQGRGSGILLPLFSLPSAFGIGDMGEGAYRFVDFLAAAGQRYWQILPLQVTAPCYDHSPYMSLSAFAGNPLFISPVSLAKAGLLGEGEIGNPPPFPRDAVDYPRAAACREGILTVAWQGFNKRARRGIRARRERFYDENGSWLEDFSLFCALRRRFQNASWSEWPREIRDRQGAALRAVREELSEEIARERFCQFLFFDQWRQLKRYCNDRHVRIIGDMPIYVGHDSADVWSHPGLFRLDRKRRPAVVSGVPPDGAGGTGQLWGHPLYRWDELKKSGYEWMVGRIAHQASLFDCVRIDHFRGFVNYWEVPATAATAAEGRWVAAPACHFFATLAQRLPSLQLLCEDLGVSPPDFREVMDHFGLPGMRVLQFAFGKGLPKSPHAPHNHPANCVVYTGTHDSNTARGWYAKEATAQERARLARYIGRPLSRRELHWELIRLAMISAAAVAIVPMQDILGMGEEARMNRPGTGEGNWRWRVREESLTPLLARRLLTMTTLYGRTGSRKGEKRAPRMHHHS